MKKTLFKWLFVALLVMAGFTLSWAGSGDPVLENKAITGTLGFDTGTTINEFSTDGTFAGNSDDALPTEKAVKTHSDANYGSKTTGAWSKSIGSGGDYADWATMIAAMPDMISHGATVTIKAGTTLTETCNLRNKHGLTSAAEIIIQAEKYFPTSGDIPTADSATATTLRDAALATAALGDDYFNNCWVFVVDGTGTDNGFVAITDYVDATGDVVVASWPGTQPDNTSRYLIVGALVDGESARAYCANVQNNTVLILWRGIGHKGSTSDGFFCRYCVSVDLKYCGAYAIPKSGFYIQSTNTSDLSYSGIVGCNTANDSNRAGISLVAVKYGYIINNGVSDNLRQGIFVSLGGYSSVTNCFGDNNGTWGTYAASSGQANCGGTECSGSSGDHKVNTIFPLEDLDMDTHKIVNVVDPVSAQDAATKAYGDANWVDSAYGAASYPDYNEADQGATGGGASAKAYIDTIAANNATLVFRHNSGAATTTYTFATSETIPANITVVREEGALLQFNNGVTLTEDGVFESPKSKAFTWTGTGKIVFGDGACLKVYPEYWGTNTTPGTTDMTDALNAAGAQTEGVLILSNWYKTTDVVRSSISIEGTGIDKAIIDASGGNLAAWTTGSDPDLAYNMMLYVTGAGLTALPNLGSNATKGDRVLTFASNPTLSEGDLVLIFNPTNNSFSMWRDYYKAGEYVKVKSVSGTTVNLYSSLFDSYTTGAVSVYKVNTISGYAKDFTIIGTGSGAAGFDHCFVLNYAKNYKISNVKTYDWSRSGITVKQGYDVSIDDCVSYTNYAGLDIYPLMIGNAQNIYVNRGYYSSNWHGISLGGSSWTGCVPNRNINIDGAHVVSTGTAYAFGMHGNIEHAKVINCLLDGGICLAGNYITCQNNTILSDVSIPVYGYESKGLHHDISNNIIISSYSHVAHAGLIDYGGGSNSITANTTEDGVLTITDNQMIWLTSTADRRPVAFQNRGCTAKIGINFSGNTLTVPNVNSGVFHISKASGSYWDNVKISDNVIECPLNVNHVTYLSTNGNNRLYGADTFAGITHHQINNMVQYGTAEPLTIAANGITVTKSYHSIIVEGGTGSGADLLTIAAGGIEGDELILKVATSGGLDQITVTNGTGAGYFILEGGVTFVMDHVDDRIKFLHNGTEWVEMGRSDNS